MEIIYSLKALEDINYWKESGNKAVQEKISALIDDINLPNANLNQPKPILV